MVRRDKTGTELRMKEPHGEGVASHSGPESCADGREAGGEALTGVHAGGASEPRKHHSGVPTLSSEAEGNTDHAVIARHGRALRGQETQARMEARCAEPGRSHEHPSREGGGSLREVQGRTPEVHERGKSDSPVVPKKSPNKARRGAAEVMEGRELAKGNLREQNASRTQCRNSAHSALARVREAARKDRKQRFTALLHHATTVDRLRDAYLALNREASAGIDGRTWRSYGEMREENLQRLAGALAQGTHRAKPARRAHIPKADGRTRPLGIPALDDKIAQRAVVEVLNAIYETDFLGFSYGFRPGRNPHQALDALSVGLMKRKVNWVLDADIRGFFDNLDHGWLTKFVEHRVGDPRIVRLIQKWLSAGVLEDGTWTRSEVGTVQGGSISPLLGNIYLHYTFDLWVQRWRDRCATGNMIVVRYADDFIVGFEHRRDAERFLAELRERFAKFNLELHAEKTRLIEFGRWATKNRRSRGAGKPETFDFLGFTHICSTTRQGYFSVLRQTVRKRQQSKLKAIKQELWRRMHHSIPEQGAYLRSVVNGHLQYYGVPFNYSAVFAFRTGAVWLWWRSLQRRSQRHRMPWHRMRRHVDRWIPRAHICHPQPLKRFGATHPRQEPDAGNLHVRICGGGHE